jgi:hypothetical protein
MRVAATETLAPTTPGEGKTFGKSMLISEFALYKSTAKSMPRFQATQRAPADAVHRALRVSAGVTPCVVSRCAKSVILFGNVSRLL